MSRSRRSAFTIFQLLVLLALLALLFALLLPAVAKVRLAAARTQSVNNLRQFGTAINNIASNSTTGELVPGEDDNHFSASAYLLPYFESPDMQALYKKIDFKKSIDDKANAAARMTVVKMYLSPLDPVMQVNDDRAATNYLWNDKLFYLNSKARLPNSFGGRTSATIVIGETLKGDPNAAADDVHRRHVQLKKEDLKDLKAETGVEDFKKGKNVVATRCASWMDGRFLQGRFNGVLALNDERPDVDCGGVGGAATLRSLNGLILVGLGDGSARTIDAKNISHKTLQWALDPALTDPQPSDW